VIAQVFGALTMLVMLGVPFLVIWLSGRGNWAKMRQKARDRRQLILDTPTSPIRGWAGGHVEVKGRAVPTEQGLLCAPFSGRHAVYCLAQVLEQSGGEGTWFPIASEVTAREFYVDDGSGERARLIPTGADFVLEAVEVFTPGPFKNPHRNCIAFLAQRGISTTTHFGFNRRLRFEESLVIPGDLIYAIGPSQRGTFGGSNANEIIMFTQGPDPYQLVVTNTSEEALANRSWLRWK